MDIRGHFATGGSIKSEENKKNTPADKDNDKRANEDGKLLPPKPKFLPSWKTDVSVGCVSRWHDVLHCLRRKTKFVGFVIESSG